MDTLPPRGERRKVINGFVEGCCDRISDVTGGGHGAFT
jgi:hypothetical protein